MGSGNGAAGFHRECWVAMAGFKTHISTSGLLGVGYGAVGYAQLHLPLPTCVLAGGLCAVSGMLPDLDSDSGVPLRESLAFASAVVPMLAVERLKQAGLAPESIVLAGALIYLLIRFVAGELLRRYTVHRGMFHSIPAMLIFAEFTFLICGDHDLRLRIYKSAGVALGFFSHLLLDELYSIEWRRGRLRLKKSFGTALKLWGKSPWANFTTYLKLAFLTLLILNDPTWAHMLDPDGKYSMPADRVAHEQPADVQPVERK